MSVAAGTPHIIAERVSGSDADIAAMGVDAPVAGSGIINN